MNRQELISEATRSLLRDWATDAGPIIIHFVSEQLDQALAHHHEVESPAVTGMASGLQPWLDEPDHGRRSLLDDIVTMVATEEQARKTKRVKVFLRQSGSPPHMTLAAFDPMRVVGLTPAHLATLATIAWMERRRNLILTGEPRAGKTHLACGLAAEAVRKGWTVTYVHYLVLLEHWDTTHRRGEVDLFRPGDHAVSAAGD